MANKKNLLMIAGIVIALFFVVAYGANKFGLFSLLPPADSFFLYGQSDVDITNKTCVSTAPPVTGAPNGQSCNAAFYSWTGSQCSSGGDGSCTTSWSVTGSDVDLVLSSSGGKYGSQGQSPQLRIKEDFSSRDVRADFDVTYSGVYGFTTAQALAISSSAAGTLASESFSPQGQGSATFSGSLELKRKVFSNTTDVYWKGILVKNYPTPASEKLIFSVIANQGSITAHVKNLRYLPTFSCQLSSTDLLAFESFSGGVTTGISIQPSLCTGNTTTSCPRYPIKSFCLAHPAILTDSTQNGSLSTAEPYQMLIGGQTVPVTQTQTLSLFYVLDNSAGLVPTQCSIQQTYNVNNGTCTDLTGIVQICSQGILDSQTGLCVVQPSVSCSNGTYNSQTNICEYAPPSAYVCEAGYSYNNATGYCEKTPQSVSVCTNGRYDVQTQTCIYNPPVSTQCNNGTYNNATGQCELRIDVSCPSGLTYDPATQSCKGAPVYSGQQTTQVQNGTTTPLTKSTTITIAKEESIWFNPFTGLLILLIIGSIAYMIFFFGRNGRRRWEKFKSWLKVNSEGIVVGLAVASVVLFVQFYQVFFIPIIGTLLEWMRGSYPLWIVAFVILLIGMFFGAIVDWIIDPKH